VVTAIGQLKDGLNTVWLLTCRFMLALCRQKGTAVCSVPTTNPDQRSSAPPPLKHRHCSVKQAIRTVFNVAVGADAGDMQRTARNALLQILNTVLKHVTLYPLVRSLVGHMPMRLCCNCAASLLSLPELQI
jgi:hypothetical protein